MFPSFFDASYLIFAAPAVLIMLVAQFVVRRAYTKQSRVRNVTGQTGAEIARRLLDSAGLNDVSVRMVPGELSDHYDPRRRALYLSEHVYSAPSVAAMGIAAHEVGHAIQHQLGYAPLRLRVVLVRIVNLSSWFGYVLFVLGFVVQVSGLIWLGTLLFSSAVLFAIVTLPVEYDASSRALRLLQSSGILGQVELAGAKSVLSAAAFTYIAALLQAAGQLLYWVLVAIGSERREQ